VSALTRDSQTIVVAAFVVALGRPQGPTLLPCFSHSFALFALKMVFVLSSFFTPKIR